MAGTATAAGLDTDALHDWLAAHRPDWPAPGRWRAQRLAGGQSNPTWRLQADDGRAWALRARPGPAASLPPSAHAIEREWRVLRALRGSAVPVPEALLLCEDESVLGAAFYLMPWVDGRIFRDASLPEVAPAQRAALHAEAARVLAALHRVDWRAAGLEGFGRTEDFAQRQIARWSRQYQASLGAGMDPLPAMDALLDWLPSHVPASAAEVPATLVHGDYRIENMVFDAQRPQVRAVLDWELCTLGHPWSDLAYHAMAWHVPAGVLQGLGGLDLAARGLPTQARQIEAWLAHAHPDDADAVRPRLLADWPFYLALNLFRLAAILQGIGQRVRAGTAAHPQARATAEMAAPVAAIGLAIARGDRAAL